MPGRVRVRDSSLGRFVDLVKSESGQSHHRVVKVVGDELKECLLRAATVTPAGLVAVRPLKRQPRAGAGTRDDDDPALRVVHALTEAEKRAVQRCQELRLRAVENDVPD